MQLPPPALGFADGTESIGAALGVARTARAARPYPRHASVLPLDPSGLHLPASLGARSITSPAPLAEMLMTTALGAPVMTTKGPTTSAVADPPAADPQAPGASAASTSPSRMSGGGRGGSSTDLSQFNPGLQDLATSAVSAPTTTNITDLAIPAASGQLTTDITTTTPLTTGSQGTIGS